jgi:hypothetical protein
VPGQPLKFPNPSNYPPSTPAVLCPAERVIGLYNQSNTKQAQRLSQTVRTWFLEQAHHLGWGGVHFLPEVQSKHGAGCILWVPSQKTMSMKIKATMLIIDTSPDKDG